MDYLLIIIIVLITSLLFINLYKVNDLSYKLMRVRKRYDRLLRGRGELNLEELLESQSADIDKVLKKIEEYEVINNNLQNEFSEKSSGIAARLNGEIEDLNSTLTERLNMLEENEKLHFNSLNEKLDISIEDITKKQSSDINRIVKSNDEFKEELSTSTEKMLKTINDRLAFAVQKQIIHRYNALENQSGELSFTMILLDQFNNGIMITSINGRESSYAYAKEIKSGKTELACSPEEEEALNKLLNK